jgi:hypothetical protein
MKLIQATYNYLNHEKERKLGRYYSSEIYSIIARYKKPEDHFKPDPIKPEHQGLVLRGMMAEALLADILKDKCKCGDNQPKYELKIDDEITIVVKPDFEWENEVWETKYPKERTTEIPNKWKYQLECEYRATNKKVKLMVFSQPKELRTMPFNLKEIEYQPCEATWEEIIKKIKVYHNKVKQINNNG